MALIVALGVLLSPTAGIAQDLTEAEWEVRLADTAKGGPAPEAATVGGRAIDTSVLGEGAVRAERASAALSGVTPPAPPASELRARAERIVGQPAYTGQTESWWRRWLFNNPITDWIRDAWQRFVRWVVERFSFGGSDAAATEAVDPNRRSYGLGLLAAVVLGVALLSLAVVRRRSREDDPEIDWFDAVPEGMRSRQALERAAADARAAGDHSGAIRYRFLAGLITLDEQQRIRLRPSMRMSELRRDIGADPFDRAAATFERAVYSKHPASSDDVVNHSTAWSELLTSRVLS